MRIGTTFSCSVILGKITTSNFSCRSASFFADSVLCQSMQSLSATMHTESGAVSAGISTSLASPHAHFRRCCAFLMCSVMWTARGLFTSNLQ